MDPLLIVVNPAARGGAAELASDVERCCRDLGRPTVVIETRSAPTAVAEIRRHLTGTSTWGGIVSLGGDGTLRTTAEAAAGTGIPVLIVPGGTGNSMYRALWEDRPWPEVITEVLEGRARIRHLDLLRVAGEVPPGHRETTALLGLSAGLVAEVLEASERLDGVSGRDRYANAALDALGRHVPFPATVTLDGEVIHDGPLTLAAIGGARHRAGTFQLLPRSVLDDGAADVCAIAGVDAEGFVALAGAVSTGEHLDAPGVAYGQGRRIRVIRTDGDPMPVENDGDRWIPAPTRIEVEVVAGALAMFAPPLAVAG